MSSSQYATSPRVLAPLDLLDRVVILYLVFPLIIFLLGWFQWWAALPLCACAIFSLRPIFASRQGGCSRPRLAPWQLFLAIAVGCSWTVLGGTGHFVFANFDWFVRDSVLHDLVVAQWPMSYEPADGDAVLLRAPVAFYLPASLVGKLAGVAIAHFAMATWTAAGTSLFLMQLLSLTPSRVNVAALVLVTVVFFSGFDVIGSFLNDGARFFATWNIAKNLEWWAGTYQYSSMTSQLFWAPNHAFGGWLMIGMVYRDGEKALLDKMLPILIIAIALWSPLTLIGVVPFLAWELVSHARERVIDVLHPGVWLPALPVGLVVAAYLALDAGGIKRGSIADSQSSWDVLMELLRQAEFFLLEAGLVGLAILALRRSSRTVLALAVLALLPLVKLGPGNDLVWRASIPALTVLAIEAALALSDGGWTGTLLRKKLVLCCVLVIGAITPIQEIARAVLLPAWPVNLTQTLIGVNCGSYPAHYVATVRDRFISHLLRSSEPLGVKLGYSKGCSDSAMSNPATDLLYQYGLTQ